MRDCSNTELSVEKYLKQIYRYHQMSGFMLQPKP